MILTLQSVTLLVMVISLYPSISSGTLRAQFGEECNNITQCDAGNFLACNTLGKCDCIIASAMIYDDIAGKCVTLAGEQCDWTGEPTCISDAWCSYITGFCECKDAYFQNENQTCELKHTFGESCLETNQCRSSLFCFRKCQCHYEESWSVISNECVVNAGSTCRKSNNLGIEHTKQCVPNSSCTKKGSEMFPYYSCECNEHFAASKDSNKGYCYAKFNESCNGDTYGPLTSRQCLPGLVCMDRACTCEYSDHQEYDYKSEKCYSLVGGPCSTDADCANRQRTECQEEIVGIRQCQCKQGYVQVGRYCQQVYGARCDEPFWTDYGTPCDTVGGLKCINRKNICDCPGLQDFNQDELSCKGLVGARCDTKGTEQFCWTGSFCKPLRGFDQSFGLCTCSHGFTTGSDRKCVPEKNGSEIVPKTVTIQTMTDFSFEMGD